MKDPQGDPASCRTCVLAETMPQRAADEPWRGKCHLRPYMTGVVMPDQNGNPVCPVQFTHWATVAAADWCAEHRRDAARDYVEPEGRRPPGPKLILPPRNGMR